MRKCCRTETLLHSKSIQHDTISLFFQEQVSAHSVSDMKNPLTSASHIYSDPTFCAYSSLAIHVTKYTQT